MSVSIYQVFGGGVVGGNDFKYVHVQLWVSALLEGNFEGLSLSEYCVILPILIVHVHSY